jgi:hypothetical protein
MHTFGFFAFEACFPVTLSYYEWALTKSFARLSSMYDKGAGLPALASAASCKAQTFFFPM